MKNLLILLATGLVSLLFILSCKHRIPGADDLTSGGDVPYTTTSCSPDTAYFQQQVLPVFVSNCSMSGCHDVTSHEEGMILTSYTSIMASGGIRPGYPYNSKIFKKIVEPNANDRMPPLPHSALSQQQIDIIRNWILQGAVNNSCQSLSCDSTAAVTYSSTMRTLISGKCQGCHSGTSAGGGYDLSTYAGVKARVDDGRLWGSVNHITGYSAMPKNGIKLSACELFQIKKWMDAGAPNN